MIKKISFLLALVVLSWGNLLKAQYGPNDDLDGDGIINAIDLDDDNDGILDCEENGFTGPVSTYFQLNGTATNSDYYEITLTTASNSQSGQAWSKGKIDFSKSFQLRFQANLGTNISGADGIAIVFQNSSAGTSATGADGDGLGARGIANGIALELDTYANTGSPAYDPTGSNGHGRIWKTSNQSNLTNNIELGNLKDGQWRLVEITWNADTQTISYTVDGTNAGTYTFNSGGIVSEIFGGATNVYFGYTASTGGFNNLQKIKFVDPCLDLPIEMDSDNDGIPDYLDLDSDNDGCPDAIEGGGSFTSANLVTAGGSLSAGTGSSVNQNLCASSNCVDSNGIPTIAGASGQTYGTSKDATVNSCYCYKPAATSGTVLDTNHGITALSRAGAGDADQWPMVRKGAWTALESKEKGFVINRIPTTAQVEAISNPVEGMMVYDEEADCLKIYTTTDGTTFSWQCFNTQACPN
ncbi:hypothetical protein G6R40_01935 [Chryseobacterium sp. POL2]|uniref:lectin-like domain-containing protein n=1 Tax=Chryseobacterium sp. POL2 TaxID=2713414 RepID=UPI0013E1BE87|nr:L-type lectin-domain containing protein [Chryseobacterium sp. POL2]QIG88492.1 hypothetical protein G6R40_01935 [Chryseobacterium sp. POL2]